MNKRSKDRRAKAEKAARKLKQRWTLATTAAGALFGVIYFGLPLAWQHRPEVRTIAARGDAIGSLPETNAASAAEPATGSAAGAPARPDPTAVAAKGDYQQVSFAELSAFRLKLTNVILDRVTYVSTLKVAGEIPASIQALDNRRIAVQGFMLPVKLVDGRVTEFILLKNRNTCCYGSIPGINDWMTVRMSGKGVKPIMDEPLTIYGTLHIGQISSSAALAGIYRLDGDKMEGP